MQRTIDILIAALFVVASAFVLVVASIWAIKHILDYIFQNVL